MFGRAPEVPEKNNLHDSRGRPFQEANLEQGTSVSGEKMTMLVSCSFKRKESKLEQLSLDLIEHVLKYLDCLSLCRLSMTNLVMHSASNDDTIWKALYNKDFTCELHNVVPTKGWKAYYATTSAVVKINGEFFRIIRERSLPAMRQLWLNADYVTCYHSNGESSSGYDAVMESWQLGFIQDNIPYSYSQLQEVIRTRVARNMAWVTMKAFINMETYPSIVTNVYELHDGKWHMVHHHSTTFSTGVVMGPV